MTLITNDQIVFIDRYLENSDVSYADLRMEMVDHVATTIESQMANGDQRPFYDIFKAYMVQHKAGLLDGKRNITKRLTKELAVKALRKFISLPYIIGFVVLAIVYLQFMQSLGTRNVAVSHLVLVLSAFLGLAVAYEFQRHRKRIPRFSGIERLGIICGIVIQLVSFTFNISSLYLESYQILYALIFSAQLMLTIALIQIGFEQFKLFSNRFIRT
jgi:hypothetical protein